MHELALPAPGAALKFLHYHASISMGPWRPWTSTRRIMPVKSSQQCCKTKTVDIPSSAPGALGCAASKRRGGVHKRESFKLFPSAFDDLMINYC